MVTFLPQIHRSRFLGPLSARPKDPRYMSGNRFGWPFRFQCDQPARVSINRNWRQDLEFIDWKMPDRSGARWEIHPTIRLSSYVAAKLSRLLRRKCRSGGWFQNCRWWVANWEKGIFSIRIVLGFLIWSSLPDDPNNDLCPGLGGGEAQALDDYLSGSSMVGVNNKSLMPERTWTKTDAKGLPTKLIGKIDFAFLQRNPAVGF